MFHLCVNRSKLELENKIAIILLLPVSMVLIWNLRIIDVGCNMKHETAHESNCSTVQYDYVLELAFKYHKSYRQILYNYLKSTMMHDSARAEEHWNLFCFQDFQDTIKKTGYVCRRP